MLVVREHLIPNPYSVRLNGYMPKETRRASLELIRAWVWTFREDKGKEREREASVRGSSSTVPGSTRREQEFRLADLTSAEIIIIYY